MAELVVNVAKRRDDFSWSWAQSLTDCPMESFPKQLPVKYPNNVHDPFAASGFYLAGASAVQELQFSSFTFQTLF